MSRVIWSFWAQNADTYAISELQRGCTEVLNKGGTDFWYRLLGSNSHCPLPTTDVYQLSSPVLCRRPLLQAAALIIESLNHWSLNHWVIDHWIIESFSTKMLIRMPFLSSNEGEPKYSIRVVPTRVSLKYLPIPSNNKSRSSNEGDYCVPSYLTSLASKC